MNFIPQTKADWIQQAKPAVFALALVGYLLFLMEGLSTGLGVYRHPMYCWISAAFAILALVVASGPQRWVAVTALVIAILSSLYGYHANATWKGKLERRQTRESGYVHTTDGSLLLGVRRTSQWRQPLTRQGD